MHNLSQWHYSAIVSFGRYWSSHPKKLTEKEIKAIKKWKDLETKYFEKNDSFLFEKYIAGKIGEEQKKEIELCLYALKERFDFHFKKELANMIKIAEFLSVVSLEEVVKRTSLIYGQKIKIPSIYLTMSHHANHEAGGMLLGNKVILQFGDFKLSGKNEEILSILFHELTHGFSVKKFLPARFKINLPAGFTGNTKEYIDEVFLQSLWGQIGVLSQEYFNISEKEILKRKNNLIILRQEPLRSLVKDSYKVGRVIKQRLGKNREWKITRQEMEKILEE